MESQQRLTTDKEEFSSSLHNGILVIREKRHIFHITEDVKDILSLYDYIGSVLSSKAYKALVMWARSEQSLHNEHRGLLSKILSGDPNIPYLERFLNVSNKYILSLSAVTCTTVFAGQGTLSLFYLNTGLAYDYRIVGDDTVFENLDLALGLVTKGSGYFLPRLLGIRKATEVLQRQRLTAEDALQLGLVDQVVPVERLEEETMRVASGSQAHLGPTLLDIRKLLKCDLKDLERSLKIEDVLIKDRLDSPEFRPATKSTGVF